MHDPKFEKEVQQKMAELEFSPSESVWRNVEKAMNNRRNRWSLPFFWRFALPGLLLLAAGGYYFVHNGSASSDHHATASGVMTKTATATESASASESAGAAVSAPRAGALKPAAGESRAADVESKSADVESKSADVESKSADVESRAAAAESKSADVESRAAVAAGARPKPEEVTTASATHAAAPRHVAPASHIGTPSRNSFASSDNKVGNGRSVSKGAGDRNGGVVGNGSGVNDADVAANGSAVGNDATTNSGAASRNSYVTGQLSLAGMRPGLSAIHGGKLAPRSSVSTVKTLQTPKRPWEFAFAGGIGTSTLHQTTKISNYALMDDPTSNPAPANNQTANNLTASAARPTKRYVSDVGPGVSFWAGVLAQKPLTARWSLSVGLNLHYYSNSIRIGEQVNSYTPTSASLFANSAVAPIQSYPYYGAGDNQKYTNRYYFLELPVGVEWKINRSRMLPLFWNGGVSVSYLMGSSAVYYNTHSGVYFKDAGVANRTQFNLSTSLMVGLPIRGIRAQVGPQIQYGVSSLLNTELSGDQHTFYGGIRFVVYPGKK